MDLFSIGVISYLLLGGYLPFEVTTKAKYQRALNQPIVFHEDYWSEVSADAKDLIFKLVAVDPLTRLTAAEALNHPWVGFSSWLFVCVDIVFL